MKERKEEKPKERRSEERRRERERQRGEQRETERERGRQRERESGARRDLKHSQAMVYMRWGGAGNVHLDLHKDRVFISHSLSVRTKTNWGYKRSKSGCTSDPLAPQLAPTVTFVSWFMYLCVVLMMHP